MSDIIGKAPVVVIAQYEKVLVRTVGMEPIHNVTVQHAIRMLYRDKARVLVEHENKMFEPFPYPLEIILLRPIQMTWYYGKIIYWSKSAVLKRDCYKCGYCGDKASTIDHIVPVSRGGSSTWEGTTAACFRCNNRKGSKSLEELGWVLSFTPGPPRRDQMI